MSADPSWDLYRTFLAVVREQSLSAAGRALGLTQPTIARHVDALEAAVGYDLFLRGQRGLIPTEAALALVPYAENLAATAAAMVRVASGHGTGVRGTVRISASEMVGAVILPPILADLRRQHPALAFELAATDTVDDLLRRDADVAVRMVAPTQDALVARRVGDLALGLFAHRHYLERAGTPEIMADLARHSLIGPDRSTLAIRAIGGRLGLDPDTAFALRTDSAIAHFNAIRAGFGIGICQVGLGHGEPDLVRVLADAVAVDLPTYVVMHEDLKQVPRCRAVFDALVEGLTDHIARTTPPSEPPPPA